MRSSFKLKALTLFLVIALSGCGFQLRGTDSAVRLPQAFPVQVQSPYPVLNQAFERQLIQQGFKVVAGDADFTIWLYNETSDDSETILDFEFDQPFKRLNYQLTYQVINTQGEIVIRQQSLQLSTDYYQPDGTFLEQEVAKDSATTQLRKQAVSQIVNRLAHEIVNPTADEVSD